MATTSVIPGKSSESRLIQMLEGKTAPRDGEFRLRITDVRGLEGAGFAYRLTIRVERKNNFHGRVPCNALGLPPGVGIDNTGLNGVMIPEGQTSRTAKLRAADWAPAVEQPFYVIGQVESNSTTTHASSPLTLKVRARTLASASGAGSATAQ